MRTFHIGGVHPRDNKQFSALQRITECPLPKQAIIPLVQHIGATAGKSRWFREREHLFAGQRYGHQDR